MKNNEKLKVIVLCMSMPDDWRRGVVNRNYYVARELSRMGHDVHAVWYLPFDFKSSLQVGYRWLKSFFAPALPFEAAGHCLPLHWLFPSYTEYFLRRLARGRNAAVLSYHPFVDAAERCGVPAAYDLVDDLATLPHYAARAEFLRRRYAAIARDSRVKKLFAVNGEILKRYGMEGEELRNGYDAEWKAEAAKDDAPLPASPRPWALYVGTMQARFDFALLAEIAARLPEARFLCAGPVWDAAPAMPSNVSFLGRVSPARAWRLKEAADAGIIPHVRRTEGDFLSSTDSMKLYEYLAAGLPVVTRDEGRARDFSEILAIADGADEWEASLRAAFALKKDAAAYAAWRERAARLLAGTSWRDVAARIAAELERISS